MSAEAAQYKRAIHMGLGEAVQRLIHVEGLYARGLGVNDNLIEERRMIVDALNQQYQLDLGFDCNMDGVPDSVAIFATSAETSCCRILPIDERPKKTRGSSRATTKK
jgi:hypothetical protein